MGNNELVWAVDDLRDKLIKLNHLNVAIKEYGIPVKEAGTHIIHWIDGEIYG